MIRKKDLLEAIDELTYQVARQGQLISQLQNSVFPNEEKDLEKAIKKAAKKSKAQPRDKSGKFAKKNK